LTQASDTCHDFTCCTAWDVSLLVLSAYGPVDVPIRERYNHGESSPVFSTNPYILPKRDDGAKYAQTLCQRGTPGNVRLQGVLTERGGRPLLNAAPDEGRVGRVKAFEGPALESFRTWSKAEVCICFTLAAAGKQGGTASDSRPCVSRTGVFYLSACFGSA